MPLGNNLRQAMVQKNILLMTHIVLGYPSFAVNRQVIAAMVKNGVDLIEMQIPFSEPMADGPVIVKANQDALAAGATVADCLDFAAEMTKKHAIPFLFMTYYNIIFKYGEDAFFKKAKELGIQGFIVPDLPPEEGFARVKGRGGTRDRLERESLDFHRAVREEYLRLAGRDPGRVLRIDADAPEEEVFRSVLRTVAQRFGW